MASAQRAGISLPEGIPAAADIVNLRYKSCSEMEGQDHFSTVIAFWVQAHFQRYSTPTRAVLIYNLEPVFSALFALWLLHETFSANVIFGGGLILIGMCLPGILKIFSKRSNVNPTDRLRGL
ncbi:EamA family transporter [Klebsiella michiganensis]|nr:DMT family transporter [Klebsiella michiganensis]